MIAQHGVREAFVLEGSRLSFREANARANRLANAPSTAGVAPGERVGVLMWNSVEAIDANFGLEIDEMAVREHCIHALAGYKRPRVPLFDEALPKAGSGKIAKQAIRPLLQAARGDRARQGETTDAMARY